MSAAINLLSVIILMIQELLERFKAFSFIRISCKAKTVFIVGVLSLLCVISFTLMMNSGAKAEEKELLHKYYTVVTIENGDSLWDYANEYGELGYKNRSEYISEIQSINHLRNIDKLVSGETIVLPYYSYEIY